MGDFSYGKRGQATFQAADFMNDSGGRGLFTSRGYCIYEAQRMKLWSSTAIAL